MNHHSNPEKDNPSEEPVGLGPVAGPETHILILGSFPSRKSLLHHEYYGNPQNHFWRIMEALFAIDTGLPYVARLDQIHKKNIALWDVVRSCTRPGSADAAISNPVFNDIERFSATHPALRLIVLNGSTAARYYPQAAGNCRVPFIVLPSTSPANTRYTLAEKTAFWSVIKEA